MIGKEISYFTYEVGKDGKVTNTKKLEWNVFVEENDKIVVRNVFDYNWVFLERGLLVAKKKYSHDFEKFAEEVQSSLLHEYWSRCEYEIVICDLFGCCEEKVDVYTQIMLNWDRFINYVWDNKRLITRRKLGL